MNITISHINQNRNVQSNAEHQQGVATRAQTFAKVFGMGDCGMLMGLLHEDPDNEESAEIPVVNEAVCIGCGACENLCPARPYSAIYVEGHEVHKEI